MVIVQMLAEVGRTGRAGDIARTFGVDWPHLLAQTVSFCIVCFLLYRFAYRPVLTMLEQRREKIAEGLACAEKSKVQLEEAQQQREEILRQAHVEGEKHIAEARAAGQKILQRETQRASAAADQILAQAR